MNEIKIISRPWRPQDLIDDLQLMIDEELDRYINYRRTTLCMAHAYLKWFFGIEQEPLTLEQLKQMDGEPVWIKADHYGVYADVVHILGKDGGEAFVRFKINWRLQENGYGKTWLAYSNKPGRADDA